MPFLISMIDELFTATQVPDFLLPIDRSQLGLTFLRLI
jgi:hypothetical protein